MTELLFWFGHADHDRSIIFTILEVWGDHVGEVLSEMASHPDSLVRLSLRQVSPHVFAFSKIACSPN
ncbi:hypothetical protein EI969_07465 [Pseudomonas sp. PB101]|uniref:hypothetical protein n=1 Tax=Pseudomonas sp. PB101 TaxID=2495428 RepID=UPI0013662CAC|nr:hypothetical protein [Pseudomonas sp. PB101]MVW85780.1 hypothetical protein [Pseudomonas sp. PB101]